jgi:hypothetical protein
VADRENAVDLDTLLRRSRTRPAGGPSERKLDSLLDKQARKDAAQASEAQKTRKNALDQLRTQFQTELIPVVDGLREKYEAKGVTVRLDADDFLSGGRRVNLNIEFAGKGIRLEGTVTPTSIAFHQTRYSKDDPAGLAASGPSLRTHGLTPTVFRDFVCDRITAIVELVIQGRR